MKTVKVMTVDDDASSLRLVKAMLIPCGYEVIMVSSGSGVVEHIHTHQPDVVLLDIMMPDTDGYTVLSAIKADEQAAHVPVIMVTSVGMDLNKKLAVELGAADFITKPIDIERLRESVKLCLPQE